MINFKEIKILILIFVLFSFIKLYAQTSSKDSVKIFQKGIYTGNR